MTTKKGLQEILKSDLYFPVELKDNPRNTNREYSKVVTGVINGDEMDLNYCSPVYELVPNKEIFPKVEEVLKSNNIEFTVKYYHINHVRFYVNYIITDSRFVHRMNGTNDEIKPMLEVRHSYNGLTKYKILFGYYRIVCSNGLTIPVEEMKKYNLQIVGKHTSSINRSIDQLNNMLVNFVRMHDDITISITKNYETLAGGVWVENPEKRLIEVLEASGLNVVENNKFSTINDIMRRVMSESNLVGLGYNGKVNNWLLYNGINAYIHDDNRNISAPETRREKDSKVLEYMLKTA